MNLLIDIGNTSAKIAISSGENLGKVFSYKDNDIKGFIADKVLREFKHNLPEIIVVSNVRKDDPGLLAYLATICTKRVIYIDEDLVNYLVATGDRRFEVLDNMPEGMGADRVIAIMAANHLFPNDDLMLFDFGTATTIEFIDAAKEDLFENRKRAHYLGGNITLGVATRYKALSHFTQRIPLISPKEYLKTHKIQEISTIGFNLDSAMAAGNILGTVFEVEGFIARHPERKVVFTGGYSIFLADSVKKPIFVVYNLVLMGLITIAEFFANAESN